jgi:hypothetical protein
VGGRGGGRASRLRYSARGPPSAVVFYHGLQLSVTIVVLLNASHKFVQRFAVCAEVGG